jgi:hypothetical protein
MTELKLSGKVISCNHFATQGREGQKGSWCIECGVKIFEVDDRQCKDCKNFRTDMLGSFCSKLLMSVIPSMNVTFKIEDGTCFDNCLPR